MFFFGLFVVLLCIVVGARLGGIGLGTVSGIGLLILCFGLHVPPTTPPISVLLIILSLIIAVSVMQTAGGLSYLVILAESILRNNPSRITILAPFVSYLFTFLSGTGHVVYALLPVIAEVAKDEGIRPERPLSVSVISSQQAITASPISAATVSLLALFTPFHVSLLTIMLICVPATLMGTAVAAMIQCFVGKELDDDPEYQRRLHEGLVEAGKKGKRIEGKDLKRAKASVAMFLFAVLSIVILGSFPSLRPAWEIHGELHRLDMTNVIQMVMLSISALMILVLKLDANEATKTPVAQAGLIAIVSIFGIAWLGDSFVQGFSLRIYGYIGGLASSSPYFFAVALFLTSILLYSQAATALTLMPLGVSLGIPTHFLIAMFPAVNGYFFLPTYGTMLAAISLDKTGTTGIGKYILNHSFMLPGLVATTVSILTGTGIAYFMHLAGMV
jgi:anaerobic C4-dicarboxylate transporter DcuA